MWLRGKRLVRKRRSALGVTLIEVMVAMTITVGLGGVLLGTLMRTREGVVREQRTLSLQAEAYTAMRAISSVLESSVRPAALDMEGAERLVLFNERTCQVITTGIPNAGPLSVWQIHAKRPDDEDARAEVQLTPKEIEAGKTPDASVAPATSLGDERYSTTVVFAYSTEPTGAHDQVFRSRLEPGEYPEVIRVRLDVIDLEHEEDMPGSGTFTLFVRVPTL